MYVRVMAFSLPMAEGSPTDLDRYNLNGVPSALLTVGNPKTAKGEGQGYLTAILHLAPERVSGRNVCPHASAGCASACLNTAGRGGIGLDENGLNIIQAARIRRTRYFHSNRPAFMAQLVEEVAKHVRQAEKHGLAPAVRLNGTSDLPWEAFKVTRDGETFACIFEAFPSVTFYDYTKYPLRLRRKGLAHPNYSLTYSLSEHPQADERAREYLAEGYGVAAVFDTGKSETLPASYLGAPVINGDATDLRFLDPASVIVGLRAKGRAKRDESGFVRRAN